MDFLHLGECMALLDNLFWIGHASFYVKSEKGTLFIDPYAIPEGFKERADIVLVTHAHFDHCSIGDIRRVSKPGAKIVAAPQCLEGDKSVIRSRPGARHSFGTVTIEAVPAYNVREERLQFHPRANGWVGYRVTIGGETLYHAGDTDRIDEMDGLDADVALLPMGGTYTMDTGEAIEAAKSLHASNVIPMHYKRLLGKEGSEKAEARFREHVKGAVIMREVIAPAYSFQ